MLKVESWNKSFGSNHVLRDVELTVGTGETITMIGASGSGKSTFLRTLNYLETPDTGMLSLGQNESDTEVYEVGLIGQKKIVELRRQSAMVFQSFNLFRNKTALGNVMEALIIVKKMEKAQARELALSCLERVGLSDRVDYYPHMLSGGQQQRVSIARALALSPKIILFDEPTSALDPEMVGEVLNVIRSISHKDTTLIIVTHEMKFAREVSDRVCFFGEGSILESGTPEEIFEHPQHEKTSQFLRHVMSH
jgi:ABC-type polar amino acid transport system ATPase subunit